MLYGNQWAGFSGYAIDAMPGLAGGNAPTIVVSSPEEQDGGWAAGAVQIWKGDPVGHYNLDDAATIFGRSPAMDFGGYMSATCDATGDGLPDLIVSTVAATDNLDEQGITYLFSGPITADGTLDDASWMGIGAAAYDYFGDHLDAVGDVNQDGVCDWLVGAEHADNRGSLSGSAYLFLGPTSGAQGADSAYSRIDGAQHDVQACGNVAGIGDHDGDGYGDLLVGANNDEGADGGGATYLVLGPVTGTHSLAGAHAKAIGTVHNMASGYALDNAGDVDADGHLDVLVGASRFEGSAGVDDQGAVYIWGGGDGEADPGRQLR